MKFFFTNHILNVYFLKGGNMDMRNLRKPLALILALGMLAGCGSSSAAAATEAATAAAASTGKTVVIATDTDLSTMDHHIATDGTSFIAQ